MKTCEICGKTSNEVETAFCLHVGNYDKCPTCRLGDLDKKEVKTKVAPLDRETYGGIVATYGEPLLRFIPEGPFEGYSDLQISEEVPYELAVVSLKGKHISELMVYSRCSETAWIANHGERYVIRHLLQLVSLLNEMIQSWYGILCCDGCDWSEEIAEEMLAYLKTSVVEAKEMNLSTAISKMMQAETMVINEKFDFVLVFWQDIQKFQQANILSGDDGKVLGHFQDCNVNAWNDLTFEIFNEDVHLKN